MSRRPNLSMIPWRFLLKRFAFTIVALVVLFTGMFLTVVFTPDPGLISVRSFATSMEQADRIAETYLAARGRDRSILVQYVDWLTGYATFDWGWSQSQNAPVIDVVRKATLITAVYVVPATVLSTTASVVLGYYSAAKDHTAGESLLRIAVYVCAAAPAFLLAAIAYNLMIYEFHWYTRPIVYDSDAGILAERNLRTHVIPAIVLAISLFGAQTRYVRTQTRKNVPKPFTKLAEAKGASPLRVARHVLANAAMPLVSITFTELLSVFVVSVFVIEYIFEIPGLGLLGYQAINDRDLGLMFGTILVPTLVALAGNLLQDLVYAYVDPRVDLE